MEHQIPIAPTLIFGNSSVFVPTKFYNGELHYAKYPKANHTKIRNSSITTPRSSTLHTLSPMFPVSFSFLNYELFSFSVQQVTVIKLRVLP